MLSTIAALGLSIFIPAQPPTIQPMLDDLSHRAVNFFWEQSDPNTGFSKDRATNSAGVDAHTVASSASVGFALLAYPIGVRHGWLDKISARARTKLTLEKLYNLWPHEHGWLYHFVDWKTGERMWKSEASTIDTSILLAGIMGADQYWKDSEIHKLAKQFEDRIDWKWMLSASDTKPDTEFIGMGYHPEDGFIKAWWNNYDELPMIYVQAYGLYPDMPKGTWNAVDRPMVTDRSYTFLQGGPLFMHEMSHGFYDFKDKRDQQGYDYWLNTRYAGLANRAYCLDNPKHFGGYGPGFWGLSACDTPTGYQALGTPRMTSDDGTITPTSAIAMLPYAPKEAEEFLRLMMKDHADAYGRYGFSNGVNADKKWNGPDVIGIDLGMMMLGIDAAEGGFVHGLTNGDPIVQLGFKRMGFHHAASKDGDPVKMPIDND